MLFFICAFILDVILLAIVVLFSWYIKGIVKKFSFIEQNTAAFLEDLSLYQQHLAELLEMDSLRGEPIIEDLLSHSRALEEQVKIYREMFLLVEEQEVAESTEKE